jgi:ABC-type transport system substrate-binding protein
MRTLNALPQRLAAAAVAAVAGLVPAPIAAQVLSPAPPPAATAAPGERPLRLGVVQWLRHDREEEDVLVPPVYSNHLPKSLAFETLVVVDDAGRPRPGLAQAWELAADGRRAVFHLRPGATFHDGSRCDAAAVKRYFDSWLVRDRDRFVGICERIAAIEVLDADSLAFRLREPTAVLCDLALMNPMGIVGGTFPRGGPWPLVGSGAWRIAACEPMRRMHYVRHDGFDGTRPALAEFEWVTLIAGADRDPVSTWALERGHVDAVVESWRPSIPRDQAHELVAAGKATLVQGRGSLVRLLCFNHERGPFADRRWRAVVRDAVDRDAFVQVVERGFARACTTVFAPEIEDWPDRGEVIDPPADAAAAPARAERAERTEAEVLVVTSDPAQLVLAVELARQLRPHGLELRFSHVTQPEHNRRVKAAEYDLYVTRTWGTPYDPQATLHARFRAETHQKRSVFYADSDLVPLVDAAAQLEPGPARAAVYARVQHLLDEHIAVVPLYVPDRIALLGPHVEGLRLGSVIYGVDLSELRWRR